MTRHLRAPDRRPLAFAPLAVLLFGSGCREEAVSYYEVPREKRVAATAPAAPMMGDSTTARVATPGRPPGAQLEWDKPVAWTEQPPTPMRLGSYAFIDASGAKADVSVFVFPDAAGGLIANVNRWRGQVGLEPVAEADLATTATRTTIAGQAAWLVDFAGVVGSSAPAMGNTPAMSGLTRIVGAIVPLNGSAWFFKMMGPDAVVVSQREAFHQMIASIRAVTPAAAAAAGTGAAPTTSDPHAGVDMSAFASGSGSGMPGMPPGSANAGAVPPPPTPTGFTFVAPAGWQEQPSTQFRVVNYIVPGPGVPAAEFYVTPLTGAAGGELANVNRWRAQLQLPPVAEGDLAGLATTVTGPAGTFKIFDLPSTGPALKSGQRARMLAAIHVRGDTSWFFRLTGEIDHVATLRGAFEEFLKSCRFEEGR